MATLSQSESRRKYSWWWDSHNTPKNSKWLQDNIKDMDSKVKVMIKLIEEDADSFARRAEMYYKKRPELMKLVEEFYRAYRALAERYNHATVELRQAHRTMAEAFPNQVPSEMGDDSSSVSSGHGGEPHTPETRDSMRSMFDPDDLQELSMTEETDFGMSKKGLKHFNELSQFLSDSQNLRTRVSSESEKEVQLLKKSLADVQAERESIHLLYEKSLERVSSLEKELDHVQKDAGGIDERASKAEIETTVLKEALAKLEVERDAGLLQYNRSLEKVSSLETAILSVQEEAKALNERALKAENLKNELLEVQAEKDAGFLRYKQCLELISGLEEKIKVVERNAAMLKEQTERAETEIESLKREISQLNEEKEFAGFQYKKCLERIAELEREIFRAQEDAEKLSSEIVAGSEKLKRAEDQCVLLEKSNQSLQFEAVTLTQKIAKKDEELLEKKNELEKLQDLVEDERSRFAQVEASLQNLEKLHCRSQEDQRALTLELQERLENLKGLEICNYNLEDEVKRVKEENRTLSELNNSSTISIDILHGEVSSLKEMKEKLEEEVRRQVYQSNALQEEVHSVKEEIGSLSKRYNLLLAKVQSAGLNPECLESTVKKLHDEKSKLFEVCNSLKVEKNDLVRINAHLESSLLESNTKLDGSRETIDHLQESCMSMKQERSDLVTERVTLISQLQIMTESMQKLLEKNTSLENSLLGAKIELEGLRARSKSFEDFCQSLQNEKSILLNERESLVSQLERVEKRLGNLEKRFTCLEEKFTDLEKEKHSTLGQVEELRGSLDAEKQERKSYVHSSESRLTDLQSHMCLLREECKSRKREFEEELDRAVNAQVEIFILQEFVEDLEQKNLSLLVECKKHVEASNLSDKLISELESENLELQMETEFLLDEIKNSREGINQVFNAVSSSNRGDRIEREKNPIPRILSEVNNLKCSLSKTEDEKQQIVIENSVLVSLIEQMRSDGSQLESEKNILQKKFEITTEQLQKEKHEVFELNQQLKSEVSKQEQHAIVLESKLEIEHAKLGSLQGAYLVLQQECRKALEENGVLQKEFSDLKNRMCLLEEEKIVTFEKDVALSIKSLVFECFGVERVNEVKKLVENVSGLQEINVDLKQKVETFEEKVNMKEEETRNLHEKVNNLQEELDRVKNLNNGLKDQISAGHELLKQKSIELLQVEERLKATQNSNENRVCEIIGFSVKQEDEISNLKEVNKELELVVDMLQIEVEERKVREEYMNLELQEKSNEFELWDAEAASFFFDLQISGVREILLENKVHELSRVCKNLEDEKTTKTEEMKQMKEKVSELNAELSAYRSIIPSLRDDVESLEKIAIFETNFSAEAPQEEVAQVEQTCHVMHNQEGEENIVMPTASLLQEMQTKIRAIERAVIAGREQNSTPKSFPNRLKESKPKNRSRREKDGSREKIELEDNNNNNPKKSEPRSTLQMKDIPLDHISGSNGRRRRGNSNGRSDQMLELWESAEEHYCNADYIVKQKRRSSSDLQVEKELGIDKLEIPSITRVRNKKKLLESLATDAEKLTALYKTVKDLKKKADTDKKQKKKITIDPESERVKDKLQEMEEVVAQLAETNEELEKSIEGESSLDYKRYSAEMRKGSETISNIEVQLQNIEYVLLKLEDERKTKEKSKYSAIRTGILLRDIIQKGGRRSGRRKKSRFCGCIRSSSSINEDSITNLGKKHKYSTSQGRRHKQFKFGLV